MNSVSKNAAGISAEIADWSRETPYQFWDPGRKLLLTIRQYQYWRQRGGLLASFFCRLLDIRHRFWSVVTGADIPLNCQIGGGLLIPHPNGIVIHPGAEIGVNCLIFQQVTIGIRNSDGAPQIGRPCRCGRLSAKILWRVMIGAHAGVIGASTAVVTKDVAVGGVSIVDPVHA